MALWDGPPDLAPATDADRALWAQAAADMTAGWLPTNAAKIAALVLLGRDATGALWLRSPPASATSAGAQQIARALLDAGDAAGAHIVIGEG